MASSLAKTLSCGVVFLWLNPQVAFSQAAEACGTSERLLLHCTFDGGRKQVGLCLGTDDIVSYEFGPDFTAPELRLAAHVSQIEHKSESKAGGVQTQSISLMDVDTRYEIASEFGRNGAVTGGITVYLPNGRQRAYFCDTGSVWPLDPLEGIGSLNTITR